MRVRDGKSRDWVIRRNFAPWWRVVQPISLLTRRYRRRKVVPAGRHRDLPGRRSSGGESWWERFGTAVLAVVMFVLALPELILWAVPYGLAVLVLTPCALLEMLAQVLSGSVLWLLRSAGLARWRVEVIGRDQFEIHSLTVLLVRGRSTANGLVKALAAERAGALRPFAFDERCRPDDFPLLSDAKVEIVSHRSAG